MQVEIIGNTQYQAINIAVTETFTTIAVHYKALFKVNPSVFGFLIPTEIIEDAVPKGKTLVKLVLNVVICSHILQYCNYRAKVSVSNYSLHGEKSQSSIPIPSLQSIGIAVRNVP